MGSQYKPGECHSFSISAGVDIVITHGPPRVVVDMIDTKQRVGCEQLFAEVARARLQMHCFGHIQEGWAGGANPMSHAPDRERRAGANKDQESPPSDSGDPTAPTQTTTQPEPAFVPIVSRPLFRVLRNEYEDVSRVRPDEVLPPPRRRADPAAATGRRCGGDAGPGPGAPAPVQLLVLHRMMQDEPVSEVPQLHVLRCLRTRADDSGPAAATDRRGEDEEGPDASAGRSEGGDDDGGAGEGPKAQDPPARAAKGTPASR
ncbi:hypothetical protein C8A03DRAFT_34845 [Achaetomium macrosporum]|uniref:Uncharacterized protein n=1 Tax=Achaetomium macrosporum TaxID=79813 RepID=A0AAN7C884_9PEZI|nr:hypothetical protein C8A03DRAFT_34845 [Achaetomium macrosporum]